MISLTPARKRSSGINPNEDPGKGDSRTPELPRTNSGTSGSRTPRASGSSGAIVKSDESKSDAVSRALALGSLATMSRLSEMPNDHESALDTHGSSDPQGASLLQPSSSLNHIHEENERSAAAGSQTDTAHGRQHGAQHSISATAAAPSSTTASSVASSVSGSNLSVARHSAPLDVSVSPTSTNSAVSPAASTFFPFASPAGSISSSIASAPVYYPQMQKSFQSLSASAAKAASLPPDALLSLVASQHSLLSDTLAALLRTEARLSELHLLYQAAAQSERKGRGILQMDSVLKATKNKGVESVADGMIYVIKNALCCDRAAIFFIGHSIMFGLEPADVAVFDEYRTRRFFVGEFFAGTAAVKGETIICNNPQNDPLFDRYVDVKVMKAYCCSICRTSFTHLSAVSL
jgi:hypothetical protein